MHRSFSAAAIAILISALGSSAIATREPLDEAATQYPPEAGEFSVSEPSWIEVARRDGRSILLRTGPFDPAGEGELSGPPPRCALLVQFSRDLSATERHAMEVPGLRFLDTLPSRAYLMTVSPQALPGLTSHPAFAWAGIWRPEWKVEPRLLAAKWKQPLLLDLRLFPGESSQDLLSQLGDTFAGVWPVGVLGIPDEGVRLRILVPSDRIAEVAMAAAESPSVWTVDPWFLPHTMNDHSVWVVQSYDTVNTTNYALSADIWNHGITGTGQMPAVCDTGVDDDACFFRLSSDPDSVTDAQYPALPDTGTIDPIKKVAAYLVLPGATPYDGTFTCPAGNLHGTHTAGSVLGDNYATPSTPTSGGHDPGDGMAPNARLLFQDAGKEVTGCLDGLANDFAVIFQQAYDAGARIHSDSWGSDTFGAYTGDCRVLDRFVYGREDVLFCFAAGNMGSGAGSIGSPASAKNVLAVGATTHGSLGSNQVAVFSSRGPASDGRIKPDLCAPGWSIVSALGDSNHASANCTTVARSGTSMATPTAAGAATLLREYFSDGFYPTGARNPPDALNPSAALMKASLLCGAVDVSLASQASVLDSLTPGSDQGFGRVLLDTVCSFPGGSRRTLAWDRWNAQGLETGGADAFTVQVPPGQPLKAVLCWTDPEASGASPAALINDLDLEVSAPDSTLFRGNVFSGGQSSPGGDPDGTNNAEVVFVKDPAPGLWTVTVSARSVPGTPSQPYSFRQGYALVATAGACISSLSLPSGLAAADAPPTGVALTWDPVPGASGYQIYRTLGTCGAAPGDFHFLSTATGPAFTDALAEGGYTYAYRVRAVDGCAEGPASACASATSSGECHLFPLFQGVASARSDPATPECDILLSWAPGTSSCPAAPDLVYNVYRGADPYFVPGPATLLASGIAGTSYRDEDLRSGVPAFYVVRAEDGTSGGAGPAHGGNEDSNLSWIGASAAGSSQIPGTWLDDGGDGSVMLALEAPWTITDRQNHTPGGALSYHSAADGQTYPNMGCAAATTPEIALQAGQNPILTYWANFNLEYQWDGVVAEISADGGTSWTTLLPTPAYPGGFAQTGNPPLNACDYPNSQACFTGPAGNATLSGWALYSHDLTAFAGQAVRVRWRLSSDPGSEFEGFYLDDIQVIHATVLGDCLVSDGFITLDRPVYRCAGDTVHIAVTDNDLAGTGTLAVTVRSSWETTPEPVGLAEAPAGSGNFFGTVVTTASPPPSPGSLSLRNGDTLTATYLDADDGKGGTGVSKEAVAEADCVAPAISGVSITGITPTSAIFTWVTDGPANSRVTYGATPPPGTNQDDLTRFVTDHVVPIAGLSPCTLYYASVTSADGVGNSATDDRGGLYFTFTTPDPIDVTLTKTEIPPLPIPDDDGLGASSTLAVSRSESVLDLSVEVNITHPYDGDIALYLLGPDGTQVTLSAHIGVGGDNYTHTVFDDDAASPISSGTPPYTGTFRPNQPLSAFAGKSALGDWKLKVVDNSPTAAGAIGGWTLDLALAGSCPPSLSLASTALSDSCSGTGAGDHDGIVDPGEDVTLAVTLRNDGTGWARGITASLSTGVPGIIITGPEATFPDLPGSGGEASSEAPHFSFSVGTEMVCGTVIPFTLHIAAADGGPWDQPLAVTVGDPAGTGTVTVFSEGFDSTMPPGLPPGWTRSKISGNDWKTDAAGCSESALLYPNNASEAADSWAYTPGISLAAGVNYALEFKQKVSSDPENLEVLCGTTATPSGQTVPIWAMTGLKNTSCDSRSAAFTVPSSGIYHIGWHCTSPAGQGDLVVDDLRITYTGPVCASDACTPTAVPPPETAAGTTPPTAQGWIGKTTHTWPANPQATSYRVYRGTGSQLPDLLTGSVDSCTRYAGNATHCPADENPAGEPGRLYWYLVTGANTAGEGTAGGATEGTRIVDPSGACP